MSHGAMIPFDCVHVYDVTAYQKWLAEQGPKEHDPTRVHKSLIAALGRRREFKIGEWVKLGCPTPVAGSPEEKGWTWLSGREAHLRETRFKHPAQSPPTRAPEGMRPPRLYPA